MKRIQSILVATDTRLNQQPVVDAAAELATRNQALLTMVDVVPDFSWIARLSLGDHEHVRKLIRQEKAQRLEELASSVRASGVEVTTKTLAGKTSVEIVREVLRGEHDLVMAIAKGNASRHKGTFGQTARRLLRHCPCALWLVAPGASPQVNHVLGCLDTSSEHPLDEELNDKVFEMATSMGGRDGSRVSLVHAWAMQDEALLGARLSDETVAQYVDADRAYRKKLLDRFLRKYETSALSEQVHMIKGRPPEVIDTFVRAHGVDLVVLGTVARSGLSGVLVGNTAEAILDRIQCSVLALKPYQFRCPIRD